MKEYGWRAEVAWMRRARKSLPTPGSPRISKGTPGSARCASVTRSRIRAVLRTAETPSVVAPPADIVLPLPGPGNEPGRDQPRSRANRPGYQAPAAQLGWRWALSAGRIGNPLTA